MKGREQLCLQGVPQSQLRGDPAVEERPHVGAITTLRRRGEAEELVGSEVVEARTYKAILDHLRPDELLGLTATPERGDGTDVRAFFDGRVAAELRLWTP